MFRWKVEGQPPGQHFVGDDAHRVKVALLRRRAQELFGRHVRPSADDVGYLRAARRGLELFDGGDTKINDDDELFAVNDADHDVPGLEVAVNDGPDVGIADRLSDLPHQTTRASEIHSRLFDHRIQTDAFDKLHHEEWLAVGERALIEDLTMWRCSNRVRASISP